MKNYFSKFIPSKKKIKIEFCQKNLDRHLSADMLPTYSEFLQSPQIQYKEYDCLSHCKFCKNKIFAIVNGQYIDAPNPNELLQCLKSEVQNK